VKTAAQVADQIAEVHAALAEMKYAPWLDPVGMCVAGLWNCLGSGGIRLLKSISGIGRFVGLLISGFSDPHENLRIVK
jgi:hypothetical protein